MDNYARPEWPVPWIQKMGVKPISPITLLFIRTRPLTKKPSADPHLADG
jgi:hypothetical protein